MELRITGGIFNNDGTAKNAKGGTEMVRDAILSKCDPTLLEKVKIIHSRVRPEFFDLSKRNVLLLHDLWNDPESQHLRDPELRKRFSKLVFVSHHQFNSYHLGHGIPFRESEVIQNGIVPMDNVVKDFSGPLKIIYHTTPHRGLEILVPVFMKLYEKHGDKIELDIFSSFNIYGWGERDKPYQKLFDMCIDHPGIRYHGSVDNSVVRNALLQAHIFAYPSIWSETSCISAMEAMSARCLIICPTLGALPETTANFAAMYPWNEDMQTHADTFATWLDFAVSNPLILQRMNDNMLIHGKVFADKFYGWDSIIEKWNSLLNTLVNQ